jgi:uncharacterized LabA/DUF88 family protein/cold shock CspA family protein
MMHRSSSRLTRIGVFYDGNYFLHVSNYYAFNHARQSRISIRGLHEFIRHQVAEREHSDVGLCQIVDSHFFRGRIPAQEAQQRGNLLYYERVFDDILMWEGVITHYLPVRNSGGRREEKGIDVWLALEAYELVALKQFDVVVLISSDGDYVPLVRKLNTLGARVMVLSWDFEFVDEAGFRQVTRTSQELLEEVTYPVSMHELIENRTRKNDPIVLNLFVNSDQRRLHRQAPMDSPDGEQRSPSGPKPNQTDDEGPEQASVASTDLHYSEIVALKNGFGFISYPPNNLFFHLRDLVRTDFNDLRLGDTVEFTIGKNAVGEDVARSVRLILP